MIEKPTNPKIFTPQDGSCVLDLDCRDVSGDKIFDRSGKGNHGAITGAVVKPANYGLPVLKFDGVDDFVDCGSDNSLDITDAITIEAWVKLGNLIGTQYILDRGKQDVGGYQLLVGNNGWLLFCTSQLGAHQTTYTGDNELVVGNWHHIVATRNGANAKIYKNGEEIGTCFGTHIDPVSSVKNAYVGMDDINNYEFNGSIDSVRIYNRKLLASEISQRFNSLRHIYGI